MVELSCQTPIRKESSLWTKPIIPQDIAKGNTWQAKNEQENNNNNIENPELSDISNADLRQNEPENNNSNIENPEVSDISNADLRQNEPVEKEVSETEEVQEFSDFFQPQTTSEASCSGKRPMSSTRS